MFPVRSDFPILMLRLNPESYSPKSTFGKDRKNERSLELLTLTYGGPYHIADGLFICRANQWTGFYMVGTSVMKDLKILIKFMLY